MNRSSLSSLDPLNFLNYTLGHATFMSVDIDIATSSAEFREEWDQDQLSQRREWVELKDGQTVTAHFGETELRVQFHRRSDLQKCRKWMRASRQPTLARLDFDRAASGERMVSLHLMRTAMPQTLDQTPVLLIPETFASEHEELSRHVSKYSAIPQLDMNLCVMVAKIPVYLRSEDKRDVDQVDIVLANGHVLSCVVKGEVKNQYLELTSIDTKSVLKTLTDVTFLQLPEPPRLVTSLDDVQGVDLSMLAPVQNIELTAWVEYDQIERNESRAQLEVRHKHPLTYDHIEKLKNSVRKKHISWRVRLFRGESARDHWITNERDRERIQSANQSASEIKIGANIEIIDTEKQKDGSVLQGVLETLEYDQNLDRFIATVSITSKKSLPPTAQINAIEHPGERKQNERRDNALIALRKGQVKNPDLLSYLVHPSTIPRVDPLKADLKKRAGAPILNEAQKQAIGLAAREPGLLLIQGPPGTGKTTVIAEIIHNLRDRYRNQEVDHLDDPSGTGPLKVLVSSIQNDAVDNAATKLSSQEVFVDVQIKSDAKNDTRHQVTSRKIAGELWETLRMHPTFKRYQALEGLRKQLDQLGLYFTEIEQTTLTRAESFEKEAFPMLTQSLRSDFKQLVTDLSEILSLDESESADNNATESLSNEIVLPHDLKAALERVLDITAPLEPRDLSRALALAEEIKSLYEASTEQVQEHFFQLAGISSIHRQLNRAAGEQEISERVLKSWDNFHTIAHELVPTASNESEMVEDPVVARRKQWVLAVLDWFVRAGEFVQECIEECEKSEQAVLFDWIRHLNDNPLAVNDIVTQHAPVSAVTCQRSANFTEGAIAQYKDFNMVIIDEAARGGLDTLIPMTLGSSIILIGDQNQLPPHIDQRLERELDENIRRQVDLTKTSIFSYLWHSLGGTLGSPNCITLDTQFRMHRDIGEIVSRAFYDGALKHDCPGGKQAARTPKFGLFNDEPFVWLDTSDVLQNQSRRVHHGVRSWPCKMQNPYEVDLIIRILKSLSPEAIERLVAQQQPKPIGVIPFYKDQLESINRALKREVPELVDLIECGTVDSFQGKDFPLVILSTVRSNDQGSVGFLELPNRLNVGISRAKNQVILIGDSRTLAHKEKGSAPFKSVWHDVQDPERPGRKIDSRTVFQNATFMTQD